MEGDAGHAVAGTAASRAHVGDAGEGELEASFYVRGEGFEGRDVEDATAFGGAWLRGEHEAIDGGEECRDGLAATRRRKEKRRGALEDRREARELGRRGGAVGATKPGANGGMEAGEGIGRRS